MLSSRTNWPSGQVGEVQHVVHEAAQRLAAQRTASAYSRCSAVSPASEQEPGHPDDAIERRENFMAHIVEELGAQACGFERQVARAGHLLFGALTQFGRGRALIGDDRVAPS